MQNKCALLNLVNRAERGVLLPEEARILRDAIELMDEMAMTLHELGHIETEIDCLETLHGAYQPSDTQTFRAVVDDVAPGRP